MMGVTSAPWSAFADAVRARFPEIAVHIAAPGFALALDAEGPQRSAAA
jgi:hypothetical protein